MALKFNLKKHAISSYEKKKEERFKTDYILWILSQVQAPAFLYVSYLLLLKYLEQDERFTENFLTISNCYGYAHNFYCQEVQNKIYQV